MTGRGLKPGPPRWEAGDKPHELRNDHKSKHNIIAGHDTAYFGKT
jgi:hypothetical protein